MHIFFTDLDGTLLNSEKLISPRTMEAIKAYVGAGHKFVISSGRPLSSIMTGVIERTGLKVPNLLIISNNGSLIYDYENQKILQEYRLPIDDAIHIIDIAEEMGIHCQTYSEQNVVCRRHDKEIDYYISQTRMQADFDENIESLLTSAPYKALAISLDEPEKLYDLRDRLSVFMQDRYTSIFSCREFIEFIDIRSGKGNAVKNICDMLGLSPADAYAAGDANNDLSMLQAVGHSIAMKNATAEIKSVASIVTEKDCDHDGLADILFQLAQQS